MITDQTEPRIDLQHFRRTMGRYPTGVALVASTESSGQPVGMIVGTFTSVSLDPPLVAFLPAKTSTSWPRVQTTGRFAVSVLAASQEVVVRAFSGPNASKFETVAWRHSEAGLPLIEGATAWIECSIADVVDAGDHYIVLGRVETMEPVGEDLPLLFFQGGFGKFTPHSMAATGSDLSGPLALVDRARPMMERLAEDFECGCLAGAQVDDEFVILASAGSDAVPWLPSVVGRREPAAAPFGRTAMAYADEADIQRWITAGNGRVNPDETRSTLERIRNRGYSISLTGSDFTDEGTSELRVSMDPGTEAGPPEDTGTIHAISVPVFASDGDVALVISIYGLETSLGSPRAEEITHQLLETAREISGPSPAHNQ